MKQQKKQGFTLIEILIVVAIIAILASVVLVGLGPTQQQGRDARRLSDLRETQTALELYYNQNGDYPAASSWGPQTTAGTLSYILVNAGIGVSQVPNDPTNGKTYYYSQEGGGTSYVIGAVLENASNPAFTGYTVPSVGIPSGMKSCTKADSEYCLSL
jgi:general secretion pathway protein G